MSKAILFFDGTKIAFEDSPSVKFTVGNRKCDYTILATAKLDLQTKLTGLSLGNCTPITSSSSLIGALGSLQCQINYITENCCDGGGGGGTLTDFSANNLSPLFTTSVATPNTTPVLSFAAISQNQNLVYASPDGAAGIPSFRALTLNDIPDGIVAEPITQVVWGTGTSINSSADFIWNDTTKVLVVKDISGNDQFVLQGTTKVVTIGYDPSAFSYWQSGNFLIFHTATNGTFAAVHLIDGSLGTQTFQSGTDADATRSQMGNGYLALWPKLASTNELRFLELAANGVNYVGFKANDTLAGDMIWTLPTTDSTGTQALVSNGSGVLSWTSIGAGTVTNVTATSPITSSGGATPNISTSMATNRLIGRGTAGAGVMEEITIGTGLSLSGTTLNAAAGTTIANDPIWVALGDIVYGTGAATGAKLSAGLNGQVLTLAAGIPSWATPTTGTVTSVSGTANRITSSGGANPVINIDAAYDALWQPIDADLTSIAALGFASTSFLKKTAANTWVLDTNTYLNSDGTTEGATAQAQVFTLGIKVDSITNNSAVDLVTTFDGGNKYIVKDAGDNYISIDVLNKIYIFGNVASASITLDRNANTIKFNTGGANRWEILNDTIFPTTDGSNIGIATTNRIGTIYMESNIDYVSNMNFTVGGVNKFVIDVNGSLSTGIIPVARVTGLGTLATQSGTFSGTSSGTNTGDQTITLTGEATGSGVGSFAVTLANSSVIGKVITGYVSGAGVVAATDSILQAIQKLNGNIAAAGTVTSVSGTANRVTSTGGATPVIDISATFEALLGKVATGLQQFAATSSAQLAGVISDETGSGLLVFATSPALVTPVLGVASSTSIVIAGTGGAGFLELQTQASAPSSGAANSVRVFSNAGSLAWKKSSDGFVRGFASVLTADRTYTLQDVTSTLAMYSDKLSVFAATTSLELKGVISDETGSGALVFATSPTFVTPLLGTPTSGVLTNCTAATQAAQDSSTNLASTAYVDRKGYDITCAMGTGNTVALSVTNYAQPFFGSSLNATENNRAMVIKSACTIKNLYVRTAGTQSATGSLVITVRKNAAATAVTLTIAAGATAATFSDLVNSVTFAAGDKISFQIVNNATATSAAMAEIGVFAS